MVHLAPLLTLSEVVLPTVFQPDAPSSHAKPERPAVIPPMLASHLAWSRSLFPWPSAVKNTDAPSTAVAMSLFATANWYSFATDFPPYVAVSDMGYEPLSANVYVHVAAFVLVVTRVLYVVPFTARSIVVPT